MFTWDNIIHVQKHESHKRKHHYQPFTRHVCWMLSTLRTARNPVRPTAHYAAQTHTECDAVGAGGEWPEAREQDRNRHIIFSWSVYYVLEALLLCALSSLIRGGVVVDHNHNNETSWLVLHRTAFSENSWDNDVTCRGIINLKEFFKIVIFRKLRKGGWKWVDSHSFPSVRLSAKVT